jgi:hypothetical protein
MQHNANQYRARRWTAMLAVTVGVALLTAACSGGSTTSTGVADPGSTSSHSTSAAYAKALAYSECIRSHGVPNFPDPTISNGNIGLNLRGNGTLQAAQNACKSLSPVHPLTGAQEAKNVAEGLKWAQCIRSHGVPNFPDPNSSGVFALPSGMNPQSGSLQTAMNACQSVRPMQIQMSSGNPPGGS